jgi:hypothetical protein
MLSLGDKRGLARALEASAALAEAHDGDTEGASRITAAADALRDQVKAPRVGAEGRVLQFRPRRLPEEVSLEEAVRLARHSE